MLRAFQLYMAVPVFVLIVVDFFLSCGAISVGLLASYALPSLEMFLFGPYTAKILLFSFTLVISLFIFNGYSKQAFVSMKLATILVAASHLATFLALTTVFYVIPSLRIWLSALLPALAISLIGMVIIHFIFDRLIAYRFFKRKVLVLGSGPVAMQIAALFRNGEFPMLECLGHVALEDYKPTVPGAEIVARSASALDDLTNRHVDEIVVALDERRKHLPTDILLKCRMRGIEVSNVSTFLERQLGRVDIDNLHPSWMIFSSGFTAAGRLQAMLKRGFDILVSVVGLAFFAPLFVIIAVCLWFGGAGPVLYRQTRVGLNGRLFSLIKFRSMKPDAEEDGVARWASADDSRVTRLGRLLRRTRVDELPQIFNVLKGDMSFIGPRPERPEFVEILRQEVNFYDYRHTVKPGISGWAQLHYPYGASVEDAQEKLKYDLFYIKNYSLLLDVIILMQTLRVVIWPQLLAKRGEINAAAQVTTPADPLRRTS